jgi:hypothetical protein
MNWNLHLMHSSSKHLSSNSSVDGTHLKVKGFHILAHLEVANFSASNGWIGRFERRHDMAYRNLSGDSRSGDPVTVED